MRLITLASTALLTSVLSAQTTVTVTTGPANSLQNFYSLENGEVGTVALADWDLAFEINAFNSSILVNTAKGLSAFETPAAIADWATVNTADESNWTPIYNSEISWSAGALTNGNNLDQADGFNVGWGDYNIITHTIAGSKIYVIKFVDETYKKLRINSLAGGQYSFTYANLDGSAEETKTLAKSAHSGKNFGYFSFTTGATADLEPAAADWDLVFTKYTSIINAPEPTAYPVAGVLQNKNVTALQVDGVDPALADWTSGVLDSSINIIGYDWKTFNMTTFQYEYAQDRTYFVQDQVGNVWKLIFIAYGGSSNGDMTFTQELVSSVGMDDAFAVRDLAVYPNPSTDGLLNIVLDASVGAAQLTVLDMGGKAVLEQRVNGTGSLAVRPLDVSDLTSGLYVVRLQAAGRLYSSRVSIN